MKYICPVCGYEHLNDDPESLSSFEICPSCRFQFRVSDDDRGFTYEQWREQWIKNGMVWDKGSSKPPEDWNPKKQLLNVVIKRSD